MPHGLFIPDADYGVAPNGRIVVLELGRNASTDYYLRPRLDAAGFSEVVYLDMLVDTPRVDRTLLPSGTIVIINRYLTREWLLALQAARGNLSQCVYFMDDDLPAAAYDTTLPRRYRRRVERHFGAVHPELGGLCNRVWVSSPELSGRYPEAHAMVVPPVPTPMPETRVADNETCFYHATVSHAPEARWLWRIVATLTRRYRVRFEVIVDMWSAFLFRGLQNVRVRRSITWTDYLAHTTKLRFALGLAPVRPSVFNAGRSQTKFFDITRAGAVGLYAARSPYAGFIRNGRDGFMVGDDRQSWIDVVVSALEQPERLRAMHAEACRRCRELARDAERETSARDLLGVPAAGGV